MRPRFEIRPLLIWLSAASLLMLSGCMNKSSNGGNPLNPGGNTPAAKNTIKLKQVSVTVQTAEGNPSQLYVEYDFTVTDKSYWAYLCYSEDGGKTLMPINATRGYCDIGLLGAYSGTNPWSPANPGALVKVNAIVAYIGNGALDFPPEKAIDGAIDIKVFR